MSLYMAVGSPAMITYSLAITILNRNWVRQKFEKLREELSNLRDKNLRREISERLQAAQYLLQESQQVPMRASQVGGWLSSLIALEGNGGWWQRVQKDLQNSRRGYTFSLVAQIGMALIAYTFTIAITMTSSPLGTSEGSSIELTAGGGLWIWMIPLIWGWIMCGTQDRPNSITEALNDETFPAFRMNEDGKIEKIDAQRGICSRSGLICRPISRFTGVSTAENGNSTVGKSDIQGSSNEDSNGDRGDEVTSVPNESSKTETPSISDAGKHDSIISQQPPEHTHEPFPKEEYETTDVPLWLGFSIQGDEAFEGPIFNYARLFTFREFSSTITKAFHAHISSLAIGKNQHRNMYEVAESCDLNKKPLQAYTPWRETDATTWHHILIAAGAAMFLQWGTVSQNDLYWVYQANGETDRTSNNDGIPDTYGRTGVPIWELSIVRYWSNRFLGANHLVISIVSCSEFEIPGHLHWKNSIYPPRRKQRPRRTYRVAKIAIKRPMESKLRTSRQSCQA
jgi:hypothetical protein